MIFSIPSQGVTLKISPWPGIIKFFSPRESLVSDIPTGDGKITSFFTVYCKGFYFFCLLTSTLSQLYKKAFIVSGTAALREMGAPSQNPLSSYQGLCRKFFKINIREALLTLSLTNASLLVRGFSLLLVC